jgi:iron complex transport system substrate-binding protein
MHLKDHLKLWNHAYIHVIDIRRTSFDAGAKVPSYQLPTSAFLYAASGGARVLLDKKPYLFNHAHVLHGGKGMVIEFFLEKEGLEYYLILYKAILALPARKELVALMEQHNPFYSQYGFEPQSPVSLYRTAEDLMNSWRTSSPLEQLHAKTLFYQWIYELAWQLHSQGIQIMKPNLLEQAIRYMETHYREPLSLEQLAEAVGSSPRTLSRLFKTRLHSTPAQYLISFRMKQAKALLLNTDATLQEIALDTGYPDAYYLGKMFKKYFGISPMRFKSKDRSPHLWPDMTSAHAKNDIVPPPLLRYIDNDYHDQYEYEGESHMFRNTKPTLLLSLMLCFSILLTACSAGTANTNVANNPSPSPSASASAAADNAGSNQSTPAEATTRTISTVKGDIEVPFEPKRVVVLYLLGDVLALGVKPVGVSDVSEGAAFEKDLKDVQKLGTWFEASPEAVLDLNPDLIIVPSEETYQALHQIAPTILIPYETMTAEERVSMIGEVVGKKDEAKSLFDNFHKKVEQSKQKLQAAGILDKTVSIMEGGKDRSMAVIASKQFGRGSQVLYEYLGMKAPEIIQQKIDTSLEASAESVSFEVLAKYSGDYIFRSSYTGMVDLTNDPLWNSLPAVKAGRLLPIDFGLSYYSDIYSLDAQLDYVVESLLATAK